jgi:hypothetical protein
MRRPAGFWVLSVQGAPSTCDNASASECGAWTMATAIGSKGGR